MPWGNSKAQKAARQRYMEKERQVTAKAKELHKNTIKKLSDPRKALYSGIFFHIYLHGFCREKKINPILIILLLIIDFYEAFVYSQFQEWGLTETDEELTYFIRKLRAQKYTDREPGKLTLYFLTMKSIKLLKEFHLYYETRRDEQIKKNRDGHKKLQVYLSRGDYFSVKRDNIAKGIKPKRTYKW